MHYREHALPRDLAAILDVVWTLDAGAPAGRGPAQAAPVLPDGRPEIVVHWGDAFERDDAGGFTRQPAILVAGQLTRPIFLRPTGRSSMLGIRLKPFGLPALGRMPAHELGDRTPDIADVAAPLGRWLAKIRDAHSSPERALPALFAGLRRHLRPERIDGRVREAVAIARSSPRGVRVDALASAIGLTRRHLERLFRDQVGRAPKPLLRIHRLQRALAHLAAAQETGIRVSGAGLALAFGFADQAHFIRECRAWTGMTPSAPALRGAELTGLFLDHPGRQEGGGSQNREPGSSLDLPAR